MTTATTTRTADEVLAELRAMHGVEHDCADGAWFPPDPARAYDDDTDPRPEWPCPTGAVLGL